MVNTMAFQNSGSWQEDDLKTTAEYLKCKVDESYTGPRYQVIILNNKKRDLFFHNKMWHILSGFVKTKYDLFWFTPLFLKMS